MSSILAVIHTAAIVLRSCSILLHLFPEVMVAPIARHAHGGQGDSGVTIEQSKETISPAALGCNPSKEEVEDRQDGEDSVISDRSFAVPAGVVFRIRYEGLECQFPIPQPGMMGAQVADVVQRQEPGKQNLAGDAIRLRQRLLGMFSADPEEGEHVAEGHDLGGRP